ncbi:hypothetical protein C8Q76DRAFT_259101 [Earliella scabrosa]|nr:hypothetical protein C8Q76DRAFT_259101 [Earliella scabrosa]
MVVGGGKASEGRRAKGRPLYRGAKSKPQKLKVHVQGLRETLRERTRRNDHVRVARRDRYDTGNCLGVTQDRPQYSVLSTPWESLPGRSLRLSSSCACIWATFSSDYGRHPRWASFFGCMTYPYRSGTILKNAPLTARIIRKRGHKLCNLDHGSEQWARMGYRLLKVQVVRRPAQHRLPNSLASSISSAGYRTTSFCRHSSWRVRLALSQASQKRSGSTTRTSSPCLQIVRQYIYVPPRRWYWPSRRRRC